MQTHLKAPKQIGAIGAALLRPPEGVMPSKYKSCEMVVKILTYIYICGINGHEVRDQHPLSFIMKIFDIFYLYFIIII